MAIFISYLYFNLLEWLVHRFILHGLGKRDNKAFHWKHHKKAYQNKYKDESYKNFFSVDNLRELCLGVLLALIHLPIMLISPLFYGMLIVYAIIYYVLHNYSHSNPDFAKKYLPWHYDHHMRFQNSNWCVTCPLFDIVFFTYKR